jgi:hypothetical protein
MHAVLSIAFPSLFHFGVRSLSPQINLICGKRAILQGQQNLSQIIIFFTKNKESLLKGKA